MWAVLAALGAAAAFAVSTALQHLCAGRVPVTGGGPVHLIRQLVRERWWWAGQLTGALGFVLHAAALGGGSLAVVQPIMVSGLVLTLPARAALERRPPSRQQVLDGSLLAAGLCLLLTGIHSVRSSGTVEQSRALTVLAVTGVLVALVSWCSNGSRRPTARGVLLGTAAGALFGLLAGVLKFALSDLGHGFLGVMGLFTHWPLWTMLALGGAGVLLNQRAYQVAPLSASLPALNVADPVVAIVFGAVVLGERPRTSTLLVVADVLGLSLLTIGAVRLSRHHT